MKCGCKERTTYLKIEGNPELSPISCDKCNWNIKLEEFKISNELREELRNWNLSYRNLINYKTYDYVWNWSELHEQYDRRGLVLAERLQMELKEEFAVRFEVL